jgi:hypothetical protein
MLRFSQNSMGVEHEKYVYLLNILFNFFHPERSLKAARFQLVRGYKVNSYLKMFTYCIIS